MSIRAHLLRSVACTALVSVLPVCPALAQSTGTQAQEIIISGARDQHSPTGLIKAEQVPKARSSVSDEFLKTQTAGESIVQSINLLPGVSFTNNDAYGSSGGNLRLRSFDGPRVGLLLDGTLLNDSGNYAIFSNQMLDPEIIGSTTVNQGSTDVDSPTASAAGGLINILTRKPHERPDLYLLGSLGSNDYRRIYMSGNSGMIGGTVGMFGTFSGQRYDKFKGPGVLEKFQVNGRFYEDLGNNDFVSLAVHFNRNRNNFYRNLNKSQIAFYGRNYDNLPVCNLTTPGAGAQNDGATPDGTHGGVYQSANDNPANPNSCTNFYGLAINPSNTGNLRGQGSFGLTDWLRFTIDPSFQYVLANGGGNATTSETDARLKGTSVLPGKDLNGDTDTADTIRLYRPSNTNTRRYGINASLIADINPQNRFRVAYTLDYAQHRQTGEFGFVGVGGPQSIWGGKDGHGLKVPTADGSFLRNRDRYSNAILNQVAADYRGLVLDDKLTVLLGVRAPYFFRRLHQFCYTRNGDGSAGGVYCTTQTPTASALHPLSGLVQFSAVSGGLPAAAEFVRPFRLNKKYNKVLPNASIAYRLFDKNLIFVNYAENFSAPKTDNLYAPFIDPASTNGPITVPGVLPETNQAYDAGWRYQGNILLTSIDVWKAKFQNRIVSSFDPTLGFSVDRNIGNVDIWGVDMEAGFQPTQHISLYGSASYNHSEVTSNVPVNVGGVTQFLPTKGKKMVETPDWTYAARAQYDADNWSVGVQGKFVDNRFTTDVNDDSVGSYTVIDANARYDLGSLGAPSGSFAQLNVLNMFDEKYLGSISSTNAANNIVFLSGTFTGSAPSFAIPSPRTFQFSVGMDF